MTIIDVCIFEKNFKILNDEIFVFFNNVSFGQGVFKAVKLYWKKFSAESMISLIVCCKCEQITSVYTDYSKEDSKFM